MSAVLSLPPAKRSRVALGLARAAAVGRFELQTCLNCGKVQYPPREACSRCLSDQLDWRVQSDSGELLACTKLFHSNEPYFTQRLPWPVGLVRLDCGPSVVAHLRGSLNSPGTRVRVSLGLDRAGGAVLVSVPSAEVSDMADDDQMREWSCDPGLRKVLVTDGYSQTGIALIAALVAAGAKTVWAGGATGREDELELGEPPLSIAQRATGPSPNVVPLDLDLENDASIAAAAASIGGDVDILIHNAQRRVGDAVDVSSFESAQLDMDVHYFALMRLAREFGARMRERNAAGKLDAVAWVNLLCIHALIGSPEHSGFAAAQAAAHSLSQSLRATMRAAGIRVVNVFAGPLERGAPELADAVVAALRRGVEDVYPGDVAASLFARWRENPDGLERELAAATHPVAMR